MVVKGLWKELTPVCGRCKKPLITPETGQSLVYFCPNKYDGCRNQISTEEYFKIVEKLNDVVGEAELNPERSVNLTGYKFKIRSIDCTIDKQEEGHITFSILNKKRLG